MTKPKKIEQKVEAVRKRRQKLRQAASNSDNETFTVPDPGDNFDLKYRPTRLADLVGHTQQAMARQLTYLLDHGPHPRRILLAGPPGVGKTTTARILRRCYYCKLAPTSSPCGECDGCLNESHNFFELNAGAMVGVKDMRNYLDWLDNSWFATLIVTFFIFDEVELLSRDAFACLRKPLEDLPHHTVFVLCTNELNKVPPQIRSRCLNFQLEKVSFDDRIALAKKVLAAEGANLPDEVLHEVARESDGQVRDLLIGLELALAGQVD